LWLTSLSATTAGRDLACCKLKSHIVVPFFGSGCGDKRIAFERIILLIQEFRSASVRY
jgi:hypothetical protein